MEFKNRNLILTIGSGLFLFNYYLLSNNSKNNIPIERNISKKIIKKEESKNLDFKLSNLIGKSVINYESLNILKKNSSKLKIYDFDLFTKFKGRELSHKLIESHNGLYFCLDKRTRINTMFYSDIYSDLPIFIKMNNEPNSEIIVFDYNRELNKEYKIESLETWKEKTKFKYYSERILNYINTH